jgi:hypothetical protein
MLGGVSGNRCDMAMDHIFPQCEVTDLKRSWRPKHAYNYLEMIVDNSIHKIIPNLLLVKLSDGGPAKSFPDICAYKSN